MAKAVNMRGLKVFITDLRNCKNPEDEECRVEKELANIRSKFMGGKPLSDYDKKKYVWKLLYIHMLGYDVEFGHVQGIDLMSAQKYAEKQVGYMVTSVLVNENNDFLRLSINAVRNDIVSRNEGFQCLALAFAANVGGSEFSEALANDVMKLLVSTNTRPVIKKKSALCLLRLFRRNPDIITPEIWSTKMAALLEERDIGVLGTCVTLLTAIAARLSQGYEACIPKLIGALERLARARGVPQDHTYYGIPSPWLQIRLMRCLQYFPPPEDPDMRKSLAAVVSAILNGTDVVKNVNKNNASHSVLFEAMSLVMHLDFDGELVTRSLALLGKFISVREPNIRYLGLEALGRFALLPECLPAVKGHLTSIISSLKDADISIRRRAVDLLFTSCDDTNATVIVSELLEFLQGCDISMREDLTLKIAVLAEKFAPDLSWYVKTSIRLIETAGEFVSEHVWFRVVQIITNNRDMQEFAVRHMLKTAKQPGMAEALTSSAAYILGEFSKHYDGLCEESCRRLLDMIPTSSNKSRGIILTALAKLVPNLSDSALKHDVKSVFAKYSTFVDMDLQQRAAEYQSLTESGIECVKVLDKMPDFPEKNGHRLSANQDPGMHTSAQATHETQHVEIKNSGIALVDDDNAPTIHADPVAELLSVGNEVDASLVRSEVGAGSSVSISEQSPAFQSLISSSQGVLFEDDCLQIGLRQEYSKSEGHISLFFGNKDKANAMRDVKLVASPNSFYDIQFLQMLQSEIGPNTQTKCLLRIIALQPAMDVPTLTATFMRGEKMVSISLSIPCVNTKFMIPVTSMQPSDFFSIWQSVAGPPLKVQEVVSRMSLLNLESLVSILEHLNFGILSGLDPNRNNIVAAADYVGGSEQAHCKVLIRIEIDPNSFKQFRITVLSSHAALSSTVKGHIQSQVMTV